MKALLLLWSPDRTRLAPPGEYVRRRWTTPAVADVMDGVRGRMLLDADNYG